MLAFQLHYNVTNISIDNMLMCFKIIIIIGPSNDISDNISMDIALYYYRLADYILAF